MKLCIAEKPSVGREIARVLGATASKNGYMEGNGYWVSWTFGHLCTLYEPEDYGMEWKQWRMEVLPMIPSRFRLKLIPEKGSMAQFEILKDLISKCEEVINCGDAGQEGEVIQRWVMQKAGCKVPVKRLWISSLTEEAIKEGFANLYPASDFDNLYAAGSIRAIGDWLLGMNASRAYTLKFAAPKQVISIGRVQTPTLALLVERQKAIANFKPEKFWELRTLYKGGLFQSTKGRMGTEEAAKTLCAKVESAPFTVTKVEKKKAKEGAPKLFDLTLLQVESNRKFGFSAEETLQIIQSLYEKKLTTYPRVDTNFLPNDVYPKVPGIMRGLVPYATYTQELLSKGALPKSKKVFNDKKITDHHAIIPTGEFAAASSLNRNEKLVFDLVIRRFLAVFYPDCEYDNTLVTGEVVTDDAKVEFKATGRVIVNPGWRVLFPDKSQEEGEEEKDSDEKLLPAYQVGESGPHKPEIVAKQTQPPKYMTEADLLKAMETAGKTVEDDSLRELMKANGIGRPSTRAAIIETLLRRKYIYKEKKRVMPTPMGIKLIDTIPNRLLKSAELTGQWEKKLRDISEGNYSPSDFMAQLRQMVGAVVDEVQRTPRVVLGEI